ncbi:MAG: ImmA/IrrE family metallo-endopeptidase [Acidobacteria bacterium]|nr:ImmA/IrrE family metallo-endopeptidase [Acidobacteriota bacterium]
MVADINRKAPETPFGVRLRAARKMAGMSMEDLAGRLGGLVTKQAISKYEQGRMMPSPEVLERMVAVLKDATWGASPLRLEDGLGERQIGLPGLPAADATEPGMSSMVYRRRGLLRRLAGGAQTVHFSFSSRSEVPEAEECSEPAKEGPEGVFFRLSLPPSINAVECRGERPGGPETLAPVAARRARLLDAWRNDAGVDRVQFRAGEKLPAKTEEALRYRVAEHLRRYAELESMLGAPVPFENPLDGRRAGGGTTEDIERAAAEVRGRWELGAGPVVNLLGLLEDRGVRVCETRGLEGFEGLSGRYAGRPFVAVGTDFPADRVRFTAAHELGHILRDPEASSGAGPEGDCHAFGAAFLLPRAALERVFAPAGRRRVTLADLGEIKEAYGISLQAIMYRAHALGFVTDRQLRAFREKLKARGWTVEEPVAYTGRERATRYRRLLRYAVAQGILDIAAAAEMAGLTVGELEKEVGEVF